MKTKTKILLVLSLLMIGTGYYIYDGINHASERLRINYHTIIDDKIDKELDDLQIAYVSDLHYLEFFDENRLAQLIETLQAVNGDVIIFGGDLLSKELSEEQEVELIKHLKSLDASHGKFAVLGEADYASEAINTQTERILFESDFEVLKNSSVLITNKTVHGMNLIGIDSPLNKRDNINEAYKDIDDQNYTLTIVHTPDTIDDVPQHTELVIAGHSHGGQINIPLLGQIFNQPLAELYYAKSHNVRGIQLYISNGVGTKESDVRINAPAEINVFTFKNK
ncbi:MAG: hypothetical protein GX760_04200 [Erysipelothrix sp.]|nr:hypothetical protein [Erysipelothrix sp.]